MRNINKIDDNIIALRKEYARLVEVARISALTEEEQLSYYRAQHNVACLIDGFETAKSEGWEEGRNEGRVQGQKEKQLEIAKVMKEKGIDLTTIVACTQLTEAEISEL